MYRIFLFFTIRNSLLRASEKLQHEVFWFRYFQTHPNVISNCFWFIHCFPFIHCSSMKHFFWYLTNFWSDRTDSLVSSESFLIALGKHKYTRIAVEKCIHRIVKTETLFIENSFWKVLNIVCFISLNLAQFISKKIYGVKSRGISLKVQRQYFW